MTADSCTENKIIRKNADGNIYSVPESLLDDFSIMNEAIVLAEFGSDEWHLANSEFHTMFEKYQRD